MWISGSGFAAAFRTVIHVIDKPLADRLVVVSLLTADLERAADDDMIGARKQIATLAVKIFQRRLRGSIASCP